MTVPAYINYSQFLKEGDDRSTVEYETIEELVVTVPAYFNFSLYLTRTDEEPNVCYYYRLVKTKDPETDALNYGIFENSSVPSFQDCASVHLSTNRY